VTTLGERLSIFEKRAYGHLNDIPEGRFREILRRMTSSLDLNLEIRYRRIEQVAAWKIRGSRVRRRLMDPRSDLVRD